MERRFTLGIHKNEVTGEDFVGCDYEKGECNDSCLGGTCKWSKKALKRLAELEDKIEQGTLVELPCKAGQKVYIDGLIWYDGTHWPHDYLGISRKKFIIGKITCFKINKKQFLMKIKVCSDRYYTYSKTKWFPVSAIGKTVFLTREEAEKRLKELQE